MSELDKRCEKQRLRRVKLEEIVISIAENLITLLPNQIDGGIEEGLKALGEFIGVNRVGIFLLRADGKTVDCSHEWCAPGIPDAKDGIQGVDASVFPWFWPKVINFEYVFVPDIDKAPPEAVELKKFYDSIGLKCSLDVPLIYDNKLFAYLGFSSTEIIDNWSEDDFNLFRILGQIFLREILRFRNGN